MARATRIVTGRFGIMGNGFTPVELIVVLAVVGTLLATAVVPLMGYKKSHKVDEAIRIISCIIVSQEIEKAGKSLEYYEAVGPKAHEITAKKGIEIP